MERELDNKITTLGEKALYEECLQIAERLLLNEQISRPLSDLNARKNLVVDKGYHLNLLFSMFKELETSRDHQRRGYLLQDLLNQLFMVYEIPVTKSFKRNDGGEQIDGAFSFQGWYYQVECKWTTHLADIHELDSLLGKVNRSGKQTMGLFLSIEGWSMNVVNLLKQNPEKCIILMDGYDLRSALSEAIDLDRLLNAKITKLNLEAEPFFSVVDILNKIQ